MWDFYGSSKFDEGFDNNSAVRHAGNKRFKENAARLFMKQTTWIERRVETVSFTTDGTTRREISFDCNLPPCEDRCLIWKSSEETAAKYIALPLTFLGEGELINLDVRDADGRALSVISKADSRVVIQSALEYFIYAFDDNPQQKGYGRLDLLNEKAKEELKQEIEELEKESEKSSGSGEDERRYQNFLKGFLQLMADHVGKPQSEESGEKSREGRPSSDYLVLNQVHREIMDDGWMGDFRGAESPSPSDCVTRAGDRSQCCSRGVSQSYCRFADPLLGIYAKKFLDKEEREEKKKKEEAEKEKREEEPGGSQDGSCKKCLDNHAKVRESMALDSSMEDRLRIMVQSVDRVALARHRRKLFLGLLNELYGVEDADQEKTNPRKDVDGECGDIRDDWAIRALKGLLERWIRDIGKPSLDSAEKEVRDKMAREKSCLTCYLLLLSSICDAYPMMVLVPEDRVVMGERMIIKVAFDSGYHKIASAVPLSFVQDIDLGFQTYGARSTHVEISPGPGAELVRAVEMVSPDGMGYARDVAISQANAESSHISGRMAAGRLHMSTSARMAWPLTRLRLTVTHKRAVLASFLLWSVLFAVLNSMTCLVVLFFKCWVPSPVASDSFANESPWGQQLISLYRPDSVLAVIAIILTLWLARKITTTQHHVMEDLNRNINVLLTLDLLITVTLYVLVAVGVYTDGGNIVYIGGYWSGWMAGIVVILAAMSVLIAVVSLVRWVVLRGRWSLGADGDAPIGLAAQEEDAAVDIADSIMYADHAAYSILNKCATDVRKNALKSISELFPYYQTSGVADRTVSRVEDQSQTAEREKS